jgi:hypothetical protein
LFAKPRSISIACTAVLVLACGEDRSIKWTEDVLLPDGRTVVLTRYQEFRGPSEIGQPPSDSYYWFEFKHPDTSEKVRWETKVEPGTVALMIHERTPLLLTRPRFGSGLRDFNCPNPPYLLYRHVAAGKWERIDLDQIPVKRLRANMTFGASSSIKQIKELNHHLDVGITAQSMYQFKPWIMDFANVKQTFHFTNCDKPRDDLLTK